MGIKEADNLAPQPHKGPLEEVFERRGEIYPDAEMVLGGKQFTVLVDCFVDQTPGYEFLRLLYINPATVTQMALVIMPDKLEIKRTSGPGESEQEIQPIFTKKIAPSIVLTEVDWSIHEVETISEQALVEILRQLDPRVVFEEDKESEIKPTSKPAIEIARLIGQNLGVLS